MLLRKCFVLCIIVKETLSWSAFCCNAKIFLSTGEDKLDNGTNVGPDDKSYRSADNIVASADTAVPGSQLPSASSSGSAGPGRVKVSKLLKRTFPEIAPEHQPLSSLTVPEQRSAPEQSVASPVHSAAEAKVPIPTQSQQLDQTPDPFKNPRFLKKTFQDLDVVAAAPSASDRVTDPHEPDMDRPLTDNSYHSDSKPGQVELLCSGEVPSQVRQSPVEITSPGSNANPAAPLQAAPINQVLKGAKLPRDAKKTIFDLDQLQKIEQQASRKEAERILVAAAVIHEQPPAPSPPIRPLEHFRLSSDCPVQWASMSGRSRVKYCTRCHQQVYDLSELDEQEARVLVAKHEGREDFCFYRRKDGKFQVKDCPVGAAQKTRTIVRGVAAGAAILIAAGLLLLSFTNRPAQQPSSPYMPPHPVILVPTVTHQPDKPAVNATPHSPATYIPPVSNSLHNDAARIDLSEPPVADENGVMSHPFVDMHYTAPTGGTAALSPPHPKEPWDD